MNMENNESDLSCNPANPRRSLVSGLESVKLATEDSVEVENQAPTIVNATGKRKFIQQAFHPSLFTNRQRSASIGCLPTPDQSISGIHKPTEIIVSPKELLASTQLNPNQKRHRSPDQVEMTKKVSKPKLAMVSSAKQDNTVIETSNSFSMLENLIDSEDQNKKISKPPPIVLYGVENLQELSTLLEEVVGKNEYTYKIISKNQLIISPKSTAIYKLMIECIRAKGLIGHTFTQKEERCQRVIIKHLHYSTPKEAIIEAIEETGNKVSGEIVYARKRDTKEPLNTFFLNILPHANNKQIKDIKYIYHQRVKIEDPKKRTTVVQCMRCQQYGHTKNYCMRPYRCVKCAGDHRTTDCTKDKNTPATCCLCQGEHPANFKGCQVYREIAARKFESRQNYKSQRIIPSPPNSDPKVAPITVTDNTISHEKSSKGKATQKTNKINTYSEVVKKSNSSKKQPQFKEPNKNSHLIAHQNHNVNEAKTQSKQKAPQKLSRNTVYSHQMQEPSSTKNMVNEPKSQQQMQTTHNLELILEKQAEKIDQLLQHMGILLNLMTTLISKLP